MGANLYWQGAQIALFTVYNMHYLKLPRPPTLREHIYCTFLSRIRGHFDPSGCEILAQYKGKRIIRTAFFIATLCFGIRVESWSCKGPIYLPKILLPKEKSSMKERNAN